MIKVYYLKSYITWIDFDVQWVIHQNVSGETHSLNYLGAYILWSLESGPIEHKNLIAMLYREFDCEFVEQNFCSKIISLLARFDELGLIYIKKAMLEVES